MLLSQPKYNLLSKSNGIINFVDIHQLLRHVSFVIVLLSICVMDAACQADDQRQYDAASLARSSPIRLGDRLNSLDRNDAMRIVWSPDGRSLAVYGANPSEVLLWNTVSDSVVWRRRVQGGIPRPLAITGDGRFVITMPSPDDPPSGSNELVALDTSTGARVAIIPVPVGPVTTHYYIQDVAASSDGKSFAVFSAWIPGSGTNNKHLGIDIFSTSTWAKTASYQEIRNGNFIKGSFSPDSKTIIEAYRELRSVDRATMKVDQVLRLDVFSGLTAALERSLVGPVAFPTELTLSPDGHYAAIASNAAFSDESGPGVYTPSIFIYDLNNMELFRTYPAVAPSMIALSWSSSLPALASIGSNGAMLLWDTKFDNIFNEYKVGGGASLAFSPDGATLAYSNGSQIILSRLQVGN